MHKNGTWKHYLADSKKDSKSQMAMHNIGLNGYLTFIKKGQFEVSRLFHNTFKLSLSCIKTKNKVPTCTPYSSLCLDVD